MVKPVFLIILVGSVHIRLHLMERVERVDALYMWGIIFVKIFLLSICFYELRMS